MFCVPHSFTCLLASCASCCCCVLLPPSLLSPSPPPPLTPSFHPSFIHSFIGHSRRHSHIHITHKQIHTTYPCHVVSVCTLYTFHFFCAFSLSLFPFPPLPKNLFTSFSLFFPCRRLTNIFHFGIFMCLHGENFHTNTSAQWHSHTHTCIRKSNGLCSSHLGSAIRISHSHSHTRKQSRRIFIFSISFFPAIKTKYGKKYEFLPIKVAIAIARGFLGVPLLFFFWSIQTSCRSAQFRH